MRKKYSAPINLLVTALISLIGNSALANSAAQTQPQTASQPAAVKWLNKIEKKTKKIKTLRANVRYDRLQGLLGDTQRRWGTLVYQAGPPEKFSIHFDKLAVDSAARPQNRWYIYDGHWLAEKYGNQHIFIRHELVPKGKTRDLLALGQGPFVLPLDADTKQITKIYKVKLITETAKEKAPYLKNTIQLRLTPKHKKSSKLTHINLWYNRKTLLPVQAATYDKSHNISIITLSGLKLNKKVKKKQFNTTPPRGPGWEIRIKPYHNDKKSNQ